MRMIRLDFLCFLYNCRSLSLRFWFFPEAMEGLGKSGDVILGGIRIRKLAKKERGSLS